MQQSATDAAHVPTTMLPGQSQPAPHQNTGNHAKMPREQGPESISRSEAGVSLDLSMASNMAAHGEESQDITQRGGGIANTGRTHSHIRPSDAEKWFKETNNNASARGNVSFVDGKPSALLCISNC